MSSNNFEALVTIDKNLKHQQNLTRFKVKVFVLNAPNNKLSTLAPFVEALERKISEPIKGEVLEITLTA